MSGNSSTSRKTPDPVPASGTSPPLGDKRAVPGLALYTVLVPVLAGAAVLTAAACAPAMGVFLAVLTLALTAWSARRLAGLAGRAEGERCLLTAKLMQSQKLAAVGELSSGIAHEINNPLAIISQEAELCGALVEAKGAMDPELADCLAEIARQVARGRDITRRLLDFSRKMEPVTQLESLDRAVEDMVVLVEKEARLRNVNVIRRYDPDAPRLLIDVPLLRQAVINLLTNALDALEEKDQAGGEEAHGTIVVSTWRSGPGEAAITVADDGPGVARENLARVFHPFFTTKPPGKGTGLGLSITHNIVERMGGRMEVVSEPGQGAAFTIHLPLKGETP